jgi:uncharacterized protein (DUF2126 family)
MIGQRHYAIARPDGDRYRYWRKSGNQWIPSGWVYDLASAQYYRRAEDARRAASQIEVEPGGQIEVVEVETVVARVCYRMTAHAMLPDGDPVDPSPDGL